MILIGVSLKHFSAVFLRFLLTVISVRLVLKFLLLLTAVEKHISPFSLMAPLGLKLLMQYWHFSSNEKSFGTSITLHSIISNVFKCHPPDSIDFNCAEDNSILERLSIEVVHLIRPRMLWK